MYSQKTIAQWDANGTLVTLKAETHGLTTSFCYYSNGHMGCLSEQDAPNAEAAIRYMEAYLVRGATRQDHAPETREGRYSPSRLPNPDNVGSAEYRAIHDLVLDADGDPALILAILSEFRDWVDAIQTDIEAFIATDEDI